MISNIYYMLAYAYQALRQNEYKQVIAEPFETASDLLAAILAKAASAQLKRGLSREYIEKNESLSELKGKIDIGESVKLRTRNDHRVSVNYDELSENHYMNRILKTTMQVLLRDITVKREHKDALKISLSFLKDIETLDISSINWRRFQYHRNNSTYQMLMGICYLVLRDLIMSEKQGERKLMSFFDDQKMHALFEQFVLAYYTKHYKGLIAESKGIKWNVSGNTAFLPVMRSDIMLQEKWVNKSSKKKLIIDTKFYGKIMQSNYTSQSLWSAHLYQIFAYVKNEASTNNGIVDGMLLYAKTEEGTIPNEEYVLSGNKISVKTLDLNQPFENISEQLDLSIKSWIGKEKAVKSS